MPASRRIRSAVLGGLAAALLGCGALVTVGIAASSGDLPDLRPSLPTNTGNPRWVDTYELPGRVLYRFDTVIHNDGAGAFEVYRPDVNSQTYQRVWTGGLPPATGSPEAMPSGPHEDFPITDGGSGGANTLKYSSATGHNHFHSQRIAAYELLTTGGAPVASASKNLAGFCLYDSWGSPTWYPGDYSGGVRPCLYGKPTHPGLVRMGISPATGDFYGSQLYDQWVDVTGVTPGTYVIKATADPDVLYHEKTRSNNTTEAMVTIPGAIAQDKQVSTPAGSSLAVSLSASVVGPGVRSRRQPCPGGATTYDLACTTTAAPNQVTLAVTQPPAGQGHVTLSGSTATYVPDGYQGVTSFTYTGTDSRGLRSAPATVSIAVGSGGPPPPAPPVTVGTAPATASVATGATQQFTATVGGTNAAPVWSVDGIAGGDATVGTVSSTGLYTAPAAIPAGGTVTVRATDAASGTSGAATVTVTAPSGGTTTTGTPATPSRNAHATGTFTLSARQLLINQRIGQAAIRRLAAVEAALEGAPARSFPATGGGRVTLTARQLLINQRIYQAGVRRAAALEARIEGRPAPATTAGSHGGTVTLALRQLIINQRIAQAAVRRANALGGRTG